MGRVLFDGRVLAHRFTTGVERYAKELLKRIDVEVAIPKSKNRYYQHLWEHLCLPKKAENYDTLFCPANVCPALKPDGVKYITTIHDVSFSNYPDSFSFAYRNYYAAVTKRVVDLSDVIITVSEFERRELKRRYKLSDDKIVCIYSGIADAFLNYNKKIKKENYILYVGNLTKRKNVHGIVKAFSLVYREIDLKLVLVGIKPEVMKVVKGFYKLIKEIPQEYLEFKGHINDDNVMADLYARALFFVFPSLYESFGFPALEAMACGTAVIASNVSALPEICGMAALYANPFDIYDIADKMITLKRDAKLRGILERAGRSRAGEFLWDKSAKEHAELLGL